MENKHDFTTNIYIYINHRYHENDILYYIGVIPIPKVAVIKATYILEKFINHAFFQNHGGQRPLCPTTAPYPRSIIIRNIDGSCRLFSGKEKVTMKARHSFSIEEKTCLEHDAVLRARFRAMFLCERKTCEFPAFLVLQIQVHSNRSIITHRNQQEGSL
jgi:hypothetical protein